jgi:hypothetical protein
MDLASLNIQRGRDHGLADYKSVRAAYGLPRVTSFADITSDTAVQQKLQDLYGSVDNIDLWVGALAEDHVAGSSTGPLVKAILSNQFERLRDGDRYWFENVFSGRQLAQLENTTLADVIRRNTTTTNLQSNVFLMRATVGGQVYLDLNGNGRFNWFDRGAANVAVDLINGDGTVIASTTTSRDGRYQFTNIGETGNYQVRVTVPKGTTLSASDTQSVSVTRGDVAMRGLNFGLRLLNRVLGTSPTTTSPPSRLPLASLSPIVAGQGTNDSAAPDAQRAAAVAFAQLDQSNTAWSPIDTAALVDQSHPAAGHDAVFAADNSSSQPSVSVAVGGLDGLMGRGVSAFYRN